ncbi:MAG: dienelactone hydrolase family protein [Chloroflexi bacterium]|nr:dienelactone hydrolase family protein [Chloroflexota bacterium]
MNQNQIDHLVAEWEHGALSRREFFARAVLLVGSLGAAEALLAACSPAVLPTATPVPPTTAPTTARTAAPTAASTAAVKATTPPQPTAPPPSASTIPGYVDPSAVDASQVTYPSGSVQMSALLAKPKSGGPFPAVIVIHENRGLTDHIQDVTRRVANLGYVALGVDLLSRLGGTPKFVAPADPTQAINSLKQEDVNADLVASVAYLKSQSFVRPKIGVVGFCWGGANSMQAALSSKDIAAAIIFYGRNPANLDDVQKLAGAVQGTYGELDQSITPGVPALEAAMKKYNKPFEYKIYPGANHAFFNDTGPRYNEQAAKDAWARLVEFYKKNLTG